MPFANYHAARQQPPDKYVRFRYKQNAGGNGIDFIFGVTSDGKVELQSIRASKDLWTVEAFKKWLGDNGFKTTVEPASGKSEEPIEPEIEIIPHVKRYIQVIRTPEEDDEYITQSVEARLRGRARIKIM